MSKYHIVTATGSTYDIDTEKRVWKKNSLSWEWLSHFAMGEWDGTRENIPDFYEWDESEFPVEGMNMYIQGRGMNNWFLTTELVSVEEVDEWE